MKKNALLKQLFLAIIIIILLFSFLFFLNIKIEESFESKNEITYYVITLKKKERLQNIQSQQKKIESKINLFNGVDGNDLDINSIEDATIDDLFITNDKVRKKEIGCYLSHYYLYKKIASENPTSGYTVIFEDDFIIEEDFEKKLSDGLEYFENKDFDIVYLENVSKNIGKATKSKMICEIDKKKEIYGTLAYLINNKNIYKIIENTKHINTQIDHKLENAILKNNLIAYTFCPFIVKQGEMKSTIQS